MDNKGETGETAAIQLFSGERQSDGLERACGVRTRRSGARLLDRRGASGRRRAAAGAAGLILGCGEASMPGVGTLVAIPRALRPLQALCEPARRRRSPPRQPDNPPPRRLSHRLCRPRSTVEAQPPFYGTLSRPSAARQRIDQARSASITPSRPHTSMPVSPSAHVPMTRPPPAHLPPVGPAGVRFLATTSGPWPARSGGGCARLAGDPRCSGA